MFSLIQRSSGCAANQLTKYCLSVLIGFVSMQMSVLANAKVDAVLHTDEGMKEHNSSEPRRLMHDVVLEEFDKGKIFQIVNRENSPQPTKLHKVPYHIGANLIAFNASPKIPVRVSLSIHLIKDSDGKIIMASDQAVSVDARVIEAALKLRKPEFDNSDYGKVITLLSRMSVKVFEEKLAQIKL